jgi:two-component system cell cycle response regulator
MAQHQQHTPRLLAIDDSSLIHRLLKSRLKHERLEIHHAERGKDGLAMARALLPDVILLDVDMPDMNGFDLLRELKADNVTHDIPVIFVSGTVDTSTKVRGLETGAIDFIAKPFDIAELKARVRSAVRIRSLIKMLAQRAQLDGLTGLWNRAYFDSRLAQELSEALRHGSPLSLIMCDLDHFKELNDTYGHPFGDHVLEEFADLLNHGREGDIACRYGGEEFVVIMPRTAAPEAARVAERLRSELERRLWLNHNKLIVTASFGVTDLSLVGEQTTEALITSADKALYKAKEQRNNVTVANGNGPAMKLSA